MKILIGIIIGAVIFCPFGFLLCAWLSSCRRFPRP